MSYTHTLITVKEAAKMLGLAEKQCTTAAEVLANLPALDVGGRCE